MKSLILSDTLSLKERKKAIKDFGIEASKQWPHTASEASSWVEAEYLDPTIAITCFRSDNEIVAAVYCLPFEKVLPTFPESKISKNLLEFIENNNIKKLAFVGGMFVKEMYQGKGLSAKLLNELGKRTIQQGFTHFIGITGISSMSNKLKMLPILLAHGWQRIEGSEVRSRSYDLDEVWVVKRLN